MPLSEHTLQKNKLAVDEILLGESFVQVTNREDFSTYLTDFLAQKEIDLTHLTGWYTKHLMTKMKNMVTNNQFDKGKAQGICEQVYKNFQEATKKERAVYINQPKYRSIKGQLLENGYVDINHLLLDTDIKQMFDGYLDETEVKYCDPISMTEDNGAALKDALSSSPDAPKLLIPVSIKSHYVLIIRTKINDQVNITCWDPQRAPSEKVHDADQIIKKISREVYPAAIVNYEYSGEQNDGFSCGYRVTQKAFKEAGISNALTEASPDNASILCSTFIKLLAQKDEDLKAHTFERVVDARSTLVYSKTVMDNKENQNSDKVVNAVREKKSSQVKEDEKLAIVLQDVYRNSPDLSEKEAFWKAKQNLAKLKPKQIDKTKKELVTWIQEYSKNRQPAANYKNCSNQVEKRSDDRESTVTPSTL